MGERSFQNITDANGIAIALTGMLIVFSALVMVSLFIAILPRILPHSAEAEPPDSAPHAGREDAEEMAVVAALGYAFSLRQKRPD